MKYKKIDVFIDKLIDENINDFFIDVTNDFKYDTHLNNSSTSPTFNNDITIHLVFEGFRDKTNKIKITCAVTDGAQVEIKNKTASYYLEIYRMFKIEFNGTMYLIIIRPRIKKEYTNTYVYELIKNIYHSGSSVTTEDVVTYLNLKNLKDKLYLCLILFSCNISSKTISYYTYSRLHEKLGYYGYNSIDIKNIKHDIIMCKDEKELSDLLLNYAYTILADKSINDPLSEVPDKEYYAKFIANSYTSNL